MTFRENRNPFEELNTEANELFVVLRNVLIAISFIVGAVVITLHAFRLDDPMLYVLAACSSILALVCFIYVVINVTHLGFNWYTNHQWARVVLSCVIMFTFFGASIIAISNDYSVKIFINGNISADKKNERGN